MVGEVGVHDDDEVARRELQAVHVCRSQAQFARPRVELDARRAVCFDELLGDSLGAIWRAVVDDDDLPIEIAMRARALELRMRRWGTEALRLTSR